MNVNSHRTRRTLAAGTVTLLAGAGLWLSALTPAQAAVPTCRGLSPSGLRPARRRRYGRD